MTTLTTIKFIRFLLVFGIIICCHGEPLNPSQTHPTHESQLLIDLQNILTIPKEQDDRPVSKQQSEPSAYVHIIPTHDTQELIQPPEQHSYPLRNRSKRIIPHDIYTNEIYDSSNPYANDNNQQQRAIYVNDDGQEIEKLPTSGHWSQWSAPSECSRTCGGGVATSTRQCESSACEGPDTRYSSCNTHACTGRGVAIGDFRGEQCSAFNSVPYEGRFYTWLPYTRAPNNCELNCMPQGERFYYRHKRKVTDGTSCGHDLICVNGNCLPVGCDGILGSRKRQDKCRVCGGDGNSCNTVQGVVDSNDLQVGYNDVLLIPQGATNILVRETQPTNNYLAIRNTSGHYYLNGNWRIDFPREIQIASTTFHYERKPITFFAPETIRALGPITEAIYIVILYQEANPGIVFEYSVPKGVVIDTEHGTEYAWIHDDWGGCSRECGGGTQARNVNCARRSSSTLNWDYVEPHLCDTGRKPETLQYCNYEIACPVRWHISAWDDCTAPCGSNITGSQIRNVFCEQEIQGVSALVENEKCVEAHGPAPGKLKNCTSPKTEECTYWFVGGWKGCSSLCGDGYDTRVVRCVSKDEIGRVVIHGDEKCLGGGGEKPVEYEYCFEKPCEGVDWIVEGVWGECKVPSTPTCNSPSSARLGSQSREVYCSDSKGKVYSEQFCHKYRKPNTTQSCELDFDPAEDPTCKYTWYATQWSDCQFQGCSELTKGKRTRKVFCGTVMDEDDEEASMSRVGDENCVEEKRYGAEEECHVDFAVVEKECGDEEARLRKGRWFQGPWGECSKSGGGGRRTRVVLCMVGNRTTTDVKVCGEDDVIFTSEECTGDEMDFPVFMEEEESSTDDEGIIITDYPTTDLMMMVSDGVAGDDVDDDVDSSSSSSVTEEPCEPLDEEDYYYLDLYDEEEEMMEEDDVAVVTSRSTRSVGSTTPMMMEGTTEESSSGATDDDAVTMETGSSDDDTTEDSSSGTVAMADDLMAGITTPAAISMGTGSTMSPSPHISTTPGGDVAMTTADSVMTTTTAAAVATEAATTTMPPTTTTMPTTTEAVTTAMPTTTMAADVTTTTTMATTIADVTMTTTGAAHTTTMAGEQHTTVSSAGGDMTTVVMGSTPDYDDLESVPVRMVDTSDSTDSSASSSPSPSMASSATEDASESDSAAAAVTEIEYIDEPLAIEYITTPFPMTTLPKCKPKPKDKRAQKPKPVSYCHKSRFGCCPNGFKNATGPFGNGCEIPKSCVDTEFGCCDDGVRVAEDKRKKKGCGVDCKNTLFGCCADGKTVALGNSAEGCVKDCKETEFGCCLDGTTAKKGPKGKNCPKIPCSKATFGCCPDNKTPAEGPNFLNCKEINLKNCKANHFGCCIGDGTTSALGPNEEGCPDTPPCARTKHGCCKDGITSAHGPNNEGCCAQSPYGCCPDNVNSAKGHDFEGCDCKSSPYGCCPDNITPARGEGKDACGCKFSEHGCCDDGVTTATGGNNEGCGCSTFQFGCCPDGVTVAKGVDKQGCGCKYTEFGCCPDGRTAKNSSNEDCGCEASEHGCCPNGINVAGGEEFEGCEDVPIKPGEVCGLDKERGSCRNFTVRWFFDMEYGGCSRFWWGGCEGNLNKFGTQDECRSVCVEPEGRDACYLPRVSGPCEGYYPSWYYDPVRDSCEQFVYSGCLGNNNRFANRGDCENRCLVPDRVDDCDQPKTEGPCKGTYPRWHYSKSSESCELFTYGGCKGNSNNFLTEKECHQRCGKDVRMRDVCFQPRSEGPCHEKLPRWYYDGGEQRCVPFYYSGCQGNSNRFGTLDECERTCPAALLGEVGGCLESREVGECASYTERYYFDRYEGKCKPFVYSGCGGNTNNFVHIDECRTKCESFVPKPVSSSADLQFSQEHCFLPPPDSPTPCQSNNPNQQYSSPQQQQPPTIRWYYNSHDGVCTQFRYYCSNSSLNNFDTRQDCESKCSGSQDFCSLPVIRGPCSGSFTQYYYDSHSDACVQFEYSGCSGNANRFDTVTQCEQRCKKEAVQPDPYAGGDDDERRRAYEEERRRQDEERRRAYEEDARRRQQEEEENRRRMEEEQGRGGSGSVVSQDDICVLDVDQGPCRASVGAYYYDRSERKCRQFLYGGCGGNANRFESEEMCERQCGEFRGQDVCNETPDPGPCSSEFQKVQKWFFNNADQACAQFVYSGCGGNGNRFSSRDECESVCYSRSEIVSQNDTITGAAICRLQPDTGPCVDGFKRWYYNPEEKTCIPFVFGGCAGNLNRFKSFETCVGFCEKALGYTYRERTNSNSNGVRSGDGLILGGGVDEEDEENSYNNNAIIPEEDDRYHHNPYQPPCDCSYIKCPYGISPQNSTYSCTCECYDPCAHTTCHPSSRCAVDIQGNSFVPACRSVRKPGSCPSQQPHHHRHHHGDRICDNECSSDADCSGALKCCVLACGSSCVVPMATRVESDGMGDDEISVEAVTRALNVSEGGLVEMECVARGSSSRPDVIWMRVDSNEKITGESGRFRITEHSHTHNSVTSKLQIIGASQIDTGEYTCIATPSSPSSATPPTSDLLTLHIHEPLSSAAASVLEDPTLPTTQIINLGESTNLRCYALGFPRPSVTWWRGERMLPFSSERYEQMRDYSLVVRLVGLRDLGVYTCQAYNGLGRAASWSVSLMAYGPVRVEDQDDQNYLLYVVDTGAGQVIGQQANYSSVARTTTTTTTPAPVASYYVPLRSTINIDRTHYTVGSEVRITCAVDGYPEPVVSWYKDENLIDLNSNRRIRYDAPSLIISPSTQSDSGSYRCEASNSFTTSTSQIVSITIEEQTNLHVNCTDNSFFANCKLIVKANYCTNKYYARFCCKSCTLAGQLPQYGPHLQEVGQSYFGGNLRGGSGGRSSSSNNNNNLYSSQFRSISSNDGDGGVGGDYYSNVGDNDLFNN